MSDESSSAEVYSKDQFKFQNLLATTNPFTTILHVKRNNKDYVLKTMNKEQVKRLFV